MGAYDWEHAASSHMDWIRRLKESRSSSASGKDGSATEDAAAAALAFSSNSNGNSSVGNGRGGHGGGRGGEVTSSTEPAASLFLGPGRVRRSSSTSNFNQKSLRVVLVRHEGEDLNSEGAEDTGDTPSPYLPEPVARAPPICVWWEPCTPHQSCCHA